MDQDLSQTLNALCKDGDVKGLQTFLEKTLPSQPLERQQSICRHTNNPENKDHLPCTTCLTNLSEQAVLAAQPDIFAYLWDTFLSPRGQTSISWSSLRTAAIQGSIPLAQVFWSRDPNCFNTIAPPSVHPWGARRQHQIEPAIRSDRFVYIDYMLAHGAVIRDENYDLLRMVVRCDTDDATALRRVRFLLERGVTAVGSGALRECVAGGCVELAACLLDGGVGIDDVVEPERTSALMVAAGEGVEAMVRLLLGYGADVELVDRDGRDAVAFAEGNGCDGVVRLLRAHRCRAEIPHRHSP